jgi:hypothetical protein
MASSFNIASSSLISAKHVKSVKSYSEAGWPVHHSWLSYYRHYQLCSESYTVVLLLQFFSSLSKNEYDNNVVDFMRNFFCICLPSHTYKVIIPQV